MDVRSVSMVTECSHCVRSTADEGHASSPVEEGSGRTPNAGEGFNAVVVRQEVAMLLETR